MINNRLYDLIGDFYTLYTTNVVWSIFLTSTAIHAILLIASPIQAVCKWYRRRCSDSDTPIPYVCALVGSTLWLRYSMYIEDLKLILLQSYAVIMQLFFTITLLFYRSKKRRLSHALLSITVFLSVLFTYVNELTHEDGKMVIGRFASGSQIAGSLVCPYLIYRAFKSKVIDFIPFASVLFTWVMELHAIIYSIGINDYYMTLANSTFFIMDGSLLSMFLIYPTERENDSEKKNKRHKNVDAIGKLI